MMSRTLSQKSVDSVGSNRVISPISNLRYKQMPGDDNIDEIYQPSSYLAQSGSYGKLDRMRSFSTADIQETENPVHQPFTNYLQETKLQKTDYYKSVDNVNKDYNKTLFTRKKKVKSLFKVLTQWAKSILPTRKNVTL